MSLNMRGGLAVAGGLVLGRFMVAPHDISLSANVVNENSSIGLVFSTATASDVNSNEVFTWSLLDSAGGKFAIHPTNGNLSVNGSLDFETASSHNITVQVTDKDGLIYNEIFTINVSNVNEPPVDINISSNQVWGLNSTGVNFGTATATDPDASDPKTWDFTSNPSSYFTIGSTTGNLSKNTQYIPSGNNSVTIRVTDSGLNTYSESFNMDVQYLRLEQKITNINTFGRFNTINATGDTIASSGFAHDATFVDQGKVDIYVRTGSTWSLQQTLLSPNPEANAFFGWNVSLSDDGNTLAVGSIYDTVSGNAQAGRVYIYTRSGITWTLQATLTADAPSAISSFAICSMISGDGNTLIVGEHLKDYAGFIDLGSAHIFTRSGITWTHRVRLDVPIGDRANSGNFGTGVAISNDASTVSIAASGLNSGSGYIYVYTGSGASWSLQQRLAAPTPQTNSFFGQYGHQLSETGNDLIVSGFDLFSNTFIGQTVIFTRTAGVWSHQQTIVPPDVTISDRYGISCAISKNGNIAIVQSELDDDVAANAGKIYLYTRTSGTWTQRQVFYPDAVADASYGQNPVFSKDGSRVIVGSYAEPNGGLYIYTTGL